MSTTLHPTFSQPRIAVAREPDGRVRLWSTEALEPYSVSVVHDFRAGSTRHPDRLLIAEKAGGEWRTLSWGEARTWVDRIAQGLLDRGLTERPLMILAGNSTANLVITLAAMTLGVPVVPTSVAYSLHSGDHHQLRAMADLVDPGVILTGGLEFEAATAAIADRRTVVGLDRRMPGTLTLDELAAAPTVHIDRRCAALRSDDVAKILFTSGSTGTPKGVITTHGMMSANQQQLRQIWPFLTAEPPVLLDWLPWSHTFGGSHNLNLVLTNGGSLWIDDGGIGPGLIERTVTNLRSARPNLYFNVPAGYAALLPILEREPDTARAILARLRFAFFAGAGLPQQLWERLGALARAHGSTMQLTSSWGSTESCPVATSVHFATDRSACIGLPVPGVELALVPTGNTTEARLRGPNLTPGYHRRPDLAASAFDEQGFFRTGDAVTLADPEDPLAGLIFRGRIAEDFKLATGTFVTVGTLRLRLLSAARGLLNDAVICGENAEYVSALVWLHPDHRGRLAADAVPDPALRQELSAALQRLADEGGGTSQRVERLAILTEPPSVDAREITDKGYINQRAVRGGRDQDVRLLYTDPCPACVVVRQ
ncbi:feruloyl-CoA synthase [Nocardia amikacinitolerans]|uniref:AMP-binding protein n=1 Tax=Nocardia amikacinitolerans TaxID=756689 RepID=UPI0020A34503|nr:AMP-binding protein [Nocardia amikacinitolerans]MCP2300062.1 feruloyl-CoA synthase [Nocardia amikacinitolerans]